ncbi:hypothetical protein QEZ48_08390 [Aquamicrobium lusatiense]|uniref:hypothetical protein n=1 Tax=Aquamicrobium lusatiense TaxID=89772 RepID=UPI002458F6ED|nr:hypothetical protein [Aquamicrobium lusatiense]MDH4990848.1 hypothetical protein [Aquamicrobium lusatiense]
MVTKSIPPTKPKTPWIEIDGTISSLEKAVRILCWLSEEVEKNVAVVKKNAPYGFCETFEDLASEQAYRVKALVETLKREWAGYAA